MLSAMIMLLQELRHCSALVPPAACCLLTSAQSHAGPLSVASDVRSHFPFFLENQITSSFSVFHRERTDGESTLVDEAWSV